MRDTCTCQTNQNPPGADAVAPSGATPSADGGKPLITNPVGFDFVIREIAERNPIVRQALLRRAEGWTG